MNMTYKIEIELTDLEAKVWSMFVRSPQYVVETFARHEVWRCIEQVYKEEVERLMNDPTVESIPASKETVVAMSSRRPAVEVDEEMMARMRQMVEGGESDAV